MRLSHTVRLNSAGRYATGVLTTGSMDPVTDRAGFIITAAHFLHGPAAVIRVRNQTYSGTANRHLAIFGTDIAVLRLNGHAPTMKLPGMATDTLRIGHSTLTTGFGGQPRGLAPKELHGRVITAIPGNVSRNRITRVRHGALVLNAPDRAIRGDSGGPVLKDGIVYAIQSMITDPLGFNTGLATVAQVGPFLPEIQWAMDQLR
ncbi:trypsin-like serine protease [Corynebacterium pacaense]|uniref:trypsin-like serine protease n=1 Tax=Corynebacterium pacaense TaxID=1816684 RepID=UPI0009BA3E17|nr:trypsin-like serine protease [Corynebacterium pacaense]